MRRTVTFALATAVALALVGCGSTKKPTTPPPAATTAPTGSGTTSAPPPVDATFTYESQNTIVTDLDPATSYSNEVIAMNNIYEQLTRYDSQTKTVTPLLATSWVSSDAGKTWTFTLRDGATFHSGNPVTAEAAKAAILRTKELAGGAAYIWDAVVTIDTPTPNTLVFHLKYPAPLDLISSSAYAGYIYDITAAGSEDLVKWFGSGKDAGSGAYTIGQWNKGQENELRLEAYPTWWGGWDGAHYTHALFKYVPEPTTRAQLLQSGEATFTDRLSPELFAQAQSNAKLQTIQGGTFENLIAFLNTASGPLKDGKLRKAVALSIDYDGIIAALKGSAVPASGFIPDGLLGATPGLGYQQDLAQAKTLAAPFKDVTLTMTFASGDADEKLVATIMKSNLAQIGVNLKLSPLEWQTQWDRGKSTDPSKRQDIFMMYWYPDYADPFSWFINLFRSADPPYFNMSYLNDPAVDKTIDGLQSLTATDHDGASAAYTALQQGLIASDVAVPIYVANAERVLPQGVTGYVDNPAYANVVFIHDLTPPPA